MRGILILAHGSREKATLQTMDEVVKMTRERLSDVPVETAYLQFCEQTLEKGLDALVSRGVTEITVVPYFLFSGIHIREDIPHEIEDYLKDKTGITVKMGRTLGADSRLADVLADRIRETL